MDGYESDHGRYITKKRRYERRMVGNGLAVVVLDHFRREQAIIVEAVLAEQIGQAGVVHAAQCRVQVVGEVRNDRTRVVVHVLEAARVKVGHAAAPVAQVVLLGSVVHVLVACVVGRLVVLSHRTRLRVDGKAGRIVG